MPHHISFEFFPPKTPELETKLWSCVEELATLSPDFVSVTYGAGGTTRTRTHHTVKRLREETTLSPAAHLTCVGASKDEVLAVAEEYWQAGIHHIVALRGDPPAGSNEAYTPHPEGFAYAVDLIYGLRKQHEFEVSVAAFPEKHPESSSFDEDMEVLKRKVDAGATRAITQYFFDVDHYLRLRERAQKAGITIPIIPGIIPIGHFGQLVKFSALCQTSIPDWLKTLFDGLDENPQVRDAAAIELATRQCKHLQNEGVHHMHFYTLNRSDLTKAVCEQLGIYPKRASVA